MKPRLTVKVMQAMLDACSAGLAGDGEGDMEGVDMKALARGHLWLRETIAERESQSRARRPLVVTITKLRSAAPQTDRVVPFAGQSNAGGHEPLPESWLRPKPDADGCVCNSVAHDGYHLPDCPARRQPFDSIDMSSGRVK